MSVDLESARSCIHWFSEQLPVPAVWLSPSLRLVCANRAAHEVFDGLFAESAPKSGALECFLQHWLGRELAALNEQSGDALAFEKDTVGAEGARSFHVELKRLRDRDHGILGTLVLPSEVTTQQRLTTRLRQSLTDLELHVQQRTDDLERANESLRRHIAECHEKGAALQKLSNVVEQTADHIIITDRIGHIEYVNPAFERQTGFSLADALGHTPRLVKSGLMPPEFFQQLWDTILAGDVFRAEFINRRKDGAVYHEEKTITPVRDARGHITHFVSVGRDITSRKEAETQRETLIVQLTGALANVKTLRGLLPICAWCKKIRDDQGYWERIEEYVRDHTEASFTHGLCPECTEKMLADLHAKPQPGGDPPGGL